MDRNFKINIITSFRYALSQGEDVFSNIILNTPNIKLFIMVIHVLHFKQVTSCDKILLEQKYTNLLFPNLQLQLKHFRFPNSPAQVNSPGLSLKNPSNTTKLLT